MTIKNKSAGSRQLKNSLAKWLITLGGVSVLFTLVLIFMYLLYVIKPIFESVKIEPISSYKLPVPIELESTRLGIKAQTRVFDAVSVNMRLGIAHWGYQASTPARLTLPRAAI